MGADGDGLRPGDDRDRQLRKQPRQPGGAHERDLGDPGERRKIARREDLVAEALLRPDEQALALEVFPPPFREAQAVRHGRRALGPMFVVGPALLVLAEAEPQVAEVAQDVRMAGLDPPRGVQGPGRVLKPAFTP